MTVPLRKQKTLVTFLERVNDGQVKLIQDLFGLCDANGDGKISKEELKTVMTDLGVATSDSEVHILFSHLDVDKDGVISFEEFTNGIKLLQKSFKLNQQGPKTPMKPSSNSITASASPPQPRNPSTISTSAPASAAPTTTPPKQRNLPNKPALQRRTSVVDIVTMFEPNRGASDEIKELFALCKKHDPNAKGLSKKGLFGTLKELGIEVTPTQLDELFEEFDKDKNGVISHAEFAQGMQNLNLALRTSGKLVGLSEEFEEEKKLDAKDELIAELKAQNALLTKKCGLYSKYISHVVATAVETADDAFYADHIKTADILMKLIRYEDVHRLEKMTNATLTDQELDKKVQHLQTRLTKTKASSGSTSVPTDQTNKQTK